MTFAGRVGIILLCGRVTATLRFVQQRAYGDCARRALGAILGLLLRFSLHAILRCGDTQLVGQAFHLRLELHNLGVVCLVQSGNKIADLLHLQPQIGPQHNQIIQTIAQHATVCGKQGIAVVLVKLGENPSQIAGRIVDLHILPIRDRGDGRTGKKHIAVTQPAMHRASGERPQAVGLKNIRPTSGDLLRNMTSLTQALDPSGQLSANLAGDKRRIARFLQEVGTKAMNRAQSGAYAGTIIQSQQLQRPRLTHMVGGHQHGRISSGGMLQIAV